MPADVSQDLVSTKWRLCLLRLTFDTFDLVTKVQLSCSRPPDLQDHCCRPKGHIQLIYIN